MMNLRAPLLIAVLLVGACSSNTETGTKTDANTPDASADSQPDGQKPDGQEPDGQEPDGQEPDGQEPDSQEPDSVEPDGMVSDGSGPLSYTPNISDCGGFPANHGPHYCDAEVLDWSYDAATQTLSLSDNRIPLNCCGDHSIKVALQGDTYVVTQTDAPVDEGQRCKCMCVFDFAVDIHNVPSGTVKIEVVREITDDNQPPQTVYTTTLSLSAAKGNEVIDSNPVMMGCP